MSDSMYLILALLALTLVLVIMFWDRPTDQEIMRKYRRAADHHIRSPGH